MTSINTTSTFSGHINRGLNSGSNSGHVHVDIHGQPEGSTTKPNPSSTVPFRRDPDFIDRDILAEVDKKCSKPASRAALVGLGGVGKSQLAVEYSYRIREQSPQSWVFWVHSSSAARFEEGYRMIADRVKIPRWEEPTADILQLVSSWLCNEENGRWIMILDNADDHTVFSDPRKGRLKSDDNGDSVGEAVSLSAFLHQTRNGSILVTSRSRDAALRLTGSHHDIIQVEPMDESHALLLLEKKLRTRFDKSDAIELLRALDYMPLAISQAAAYISQRAPRTTVARYLADFRKSDRNRANLLNRDEGDLRRDSTASNSIITTWQISFEYIRGKRPSATRLLSLMSFFDRQGIPEFLLRRYDDKEDGSEIDLKDLADIKLEDDGDMEFEDDVFTLTSYSLITMDIKSDQFEMHRLVQFSTRKWLELNNELEKWKNKYVRIISQAFPGEDYPDWTICQVLFPHAQAALAYRPAKAKSKYHVYWDDVLAKAASYAITQRNFLKAGEIIRRALEESEDVLGEEHPYTLESVHGLATVLLAQGKYKEAEEMNRRALEGRKKALGEGHPETLASASYLAVVFQNQGKYKAAEEMSRRALKGIEKAPGEDHPNTLIVFNNRAVVLESQGKYKTAEEMSRRVLEAKEKEFGEDHPNTLIGVRNLAGLLQKQGKYEAAEEMSRRALKGIEKALGEEHPNTLTGVRNLAGLLKEQGKYEAAEEMSRRALKGIEKALGEDHPDTLKSLDHLAAVLQSQGKYKAAEEMSRRALKGIEKTLGEDHPTTLTNLNNLAAALLSQGKYKAAEEMSRRALKGIEMALGEEHPNMLKSVTNLAEMLRS